MLSITNKPIMLSVVMLSVVAPILDSSEKSCQGQTQTLQLISARRW
jgi:hypothetical protein